MLWLVVIHLFLLLPLSHFSLIRQVNKRPANVFKSRFSFIVFLFIASVCFETLADSIKDQTEALMEQMERDRQDLEKGADSLLKECWQLFQGS